MQNTAGGRDRVTANTVKLSTPRTAWVSTAGVSEAELHCYRNGCLAWRVQGYRLQALPCMWILRWKAPHDTFVKVRLELSDKPHLSGD
jgi:hypothetical protein